MNSFSRDKYRPEIDGLRALAILPVLFFHFDVFGFGGGFVGVDVFFVISGFLIGGILWAELAETGSIRLGKFYLRRIRRLAAAYFVMIFVCLLFAWLLLMPIHFREFGKEIISSTLYISNIYFFRKSGYFDSAAEEKVLLHTWSLSVEEQFYLFFPFIVLIIKFLNFKLLKTILLIAAISLAACVVMTSYSHTAAFYLFPFRAWELLAGVALAVFGQKSNFGWSKNWFLSWIGLALIGGSVVFMPSGSNFPGALALFPVLGSVLIIANGNNPNLVNWLLRIPLFRFFGLVSYSLYLWHWPVFVFAHYYFGEEFDISLKLALIAVSVILAWLSWKFVEIPIRSNVISSKGVIFGASIASVFSLSFGAAIFFKDGMIERFGPEVRNYIEASADFHQDWRRCHTPADGPLKGVSNVCPIGPKGAPRLLIWGDSHVRAFKEGLEQLAYEENVPAVVVWMGGCPPILGIRKEENSATRARNDACTSRNKKIGAALPELQTVDRLLLIGRWNYYLKGRGVGVDQHSTITLIPVDYETTIKIQNHDQHNVFRKYLIQTLKEFEKMELTTFIVNQVPEIFNYDSRLISRKLAHGSSDVASKIDAYITVNRTLLDNRSAELTKILGEIQVNNLATVIESWEEFCSGELCSALYQGRAAYFDNNHITNTTSRRIRHIFEPVFRYSGGKEPRPMDQKF